MRLQAYHFTETDLIKAKRLVATASTPKQRFARLLTLAVIEGELALNTLTNARKCESLVNLHPQKHL